jgi:anti-sigma B factor antagonist
MTKACFVGEHTMPLTSSDHDYAQVVHVDDNRLDASVAIQFKEDFRSLTNGEQDVILEMSNVEFLDSSGLGSIVAVYKAMGPSRAMALAGLQPAVEKVMTLTRMNTVFAIFPTLEEALAASAAPHAAE